MQFYNFKKGQTKPGINCTYVTVLKISVAPVRNLHDPPTNHHHGRASSTTASNATYQPS